MVTELVISGIVVDRSLAEVRRAEGIARDKTLCLPDRVQSIKKAVFMDSKVSSVLVPANCRNIEEKAFSNCRGLKKVMLPEGLESIGEGCFEGSGLEEIVIPKSVQKIDEHAF